MRAGIPVSSVKGCVDIRVTQRNPSLRPETLIILLRAHQGQRHVGSIPLNGSRISDAIDVAADWQPQEIGLCVNADGGSDRDQGERELFEHTLLVFGLAEMTTAGLCVAAVIFGAGCAFSQFSGQGKNESAASPKPAAPASRASSCGLSCFFS